MKKIVINGMAFTKGKEIYGIHRFLAEILFVLGTKDDLPFSVEVTVPRNSEIFNNLPNIKTVQKSWPTLGKIPMILWDAFGFRLYTFLNKGLAVDLILSYPLPSSDIVGLYDCVQERTAASRKISLYRKWMMYRIKKNTQRSRAIVTLSEFSKKEIIKYHGQADKIHIVPCGWQHFERVSEGENVLERYHLQKGAYLYALGSRSPRKNDKWLICAARQNPQYTFVISGSTSFTSNVDRNDVPSNVVFTGYIPDSDVKTLMKHCKAFIQPSLIEGFGIPPMEAMSVGARCIVSNATSLPEVYGESVWYIDPLDYEHIDIDSIMSQEIKDNALVLDKYSWKKAASMLIDIIAGL